MASNPLRNLPSVNEVLDANNTNSYAHDLLVQAIRDELEDIRKRVQSGEARFPVPAPAEIATQATRRLQRELKPKLQPVINATGIVLHTNLGRAPMAEEAAKAAHDAAQGYLNLEMSLETGKRSSRQDAVREWICRLTGAPAATVVNNNAAATVIALRALCHEHEVIISRGQLIEIGGSFRIPDIMAVSGAILKEVGTTNITRITDYRNAITPETAALMHIHTSNYRVGGFTKSVTISELVELGKNSILKVIDDVGSGALVDYTRFGLTDEPLARDSIAAGADLVLFSGDKLLGGPQAGILAGGKGIIKAIERDPLMRAFRLDKMTLAALEATLRLYLNEELAMRNVPVLRMLNYDLQELQKRADALAEQLGKIPAIAAVEVKEDVAYVGGGSLPDQTMPTWVTEIETDVCSDDELARRLRTGSPAVVARVRDGRIVFDVRTIFPNQETDLVQAVTNALA